MKKIVCLFVLLISAPLSFAAEDECPPAAEAAEAQNHNLYKNCDYSDKGINGVLHRALAKKKEAADEESVSDEKSNGKTTQEKTIKELGTELTKIDEFNSPAQLQLVKYSALQRLAHECTKGFVVDGERYLPVANSKFLKLELIYRCL